MKQIFICIGCMFFHTILLAQKTKITGVVFDSVANKALANATVSLLDSKDSSLITFAIANEDGFFTLYGVAKPGNYIVSTGYIGYYTKWQNIVVKPIEINNIGRLFLSDLQQLQTVTVVSKRPPIEMKNDTLEFNSEHFKTQPNAVVEDLIKKLPGFTVDADGTIRANGQKINKLYVNGKEFFTGDPKMATKNLDADAVDKVQLFDKKSDLATFTGFDDGKSQKAINLKLKKNRNNALFGKISAGLGNNNRYEANGNINKFKNNMQLSSIAMSNNTNKQGFSFNDIMNFTGELSRGLKNGVSISMNNNEDIGLPVLGMGQMQKGIANTNAGGINFNNTFNKTNITASYMLSDINLNTTNTSLKQSLLPNNIIIGNNTTTTNKWVTQSKFSCAIDTKIDSFTTLKFTPQLSVQKGISSTQSNANSYIGINILNEATNKKLNNTNGFALSNTALLQKKYRKKGRTVSYELNCNYNNSNNNATIENNNKIFNPNNFIANNQQIFNQSTALGISNAITFSEPLNKKSLLLFGVSYAINKGNIIKNVYNYNAINKSFDILNQGLSSNFKNSYLYFAPSMGYKINRKKLNINAGINIQFSQLQSEAANNFLKVNQKFSDVLPNANISYKIGATSSINLNYEAIVEKPNAIDLINIIDSSDPFNIYKGNPNLSRSINHTSSINYNTINMGRGLNTFFIVMYNYIKNPVSNSETISSNGTRISTNVNANYSSFLYASISQGFLCKAIKSRFNVALSCDRTNMVSYINGEENRIINSTLAPSVDFNYSLEKKIDISASAKFNFKSASYSLQERYNNTFSQNDYMLSFYNYLPWQIGISNQLNYITNNGRSVGFNNNLFLWNVTLSKSFLKNKRAELKFSITDVLNNNIGISRNTSSSFIEDVKYNVLQQYFLLSFSYSLHKSGSTAGNSIVIKSFSSDTNMR
jgi:Outer membrane protein beta-barrel family